MLVGTGVGGVTVTNTVSRRRLAVSTQTAVVPVTLLAVKAPPCSGMVPSVVSTTCHSKRDVNASSVTGVLFASYAVAVIGSEVVIGIAVSRGEITMLVD